MANNINAQTDFMTPVQTNARHAPQIQHAHPQMILHVCRAPIGRGINARYARQMQLVPVGPKHFIAKPDITRINKTIACRARGISVMGTRLCAVVRDIICIAAANACNAMYNIIVRPTSVLLV